MARYILCDAGFWFALFDRRDQHHAMAQRMAPRVLPHNPLLPWPMLYEVLNTRFLRRPEWVRAFGTLLRRRGVHRLGDESYREAALESLLASPPRRWLSLVDTVLTAIIEDARVRVDALVTLNPADFARVCHARHVELLDGRSPP